MPIFSRNIFLVVLFHDLHIKTKLLNVQCIFWILVMLFYGIFTVEDKYWTFGQMSREFLWLVYFLDIELFRLKAVNYGWNNCFFRDEWLIISGHNVIKNCNHCGMDIKSSKIKRNYSKILETLWEPGRLRDFHKNCPFV